MTQQALPVINPLLEVSDFDSDAGKPMKLCLLPRKGGAGDVRFALPAMYLALANEFDGRHDIDEAIQSFIDTHRPVQEKSWFIRLVTESLMPKGIIILEGEDPYCATSGQSEKAFLHIKLPIIRAGLVEPVARFLGFLYRPTAMVLGLTSFLVMHAYVYGVLLTGRHLDFSQLDIVSILLLMLISTAATICHEFGHATAAAHFGCRNMTIGWGVYLIYTVLWTNVSDAWKLPRRHRAIVDIGGVYFESFALLALLVAYLATQHPIFLFGFIFVDLSIANTFNPFLRMDGYWLISDLFGIVNLRQQQEIWWQGLLNRVLHPRRTPRESTLKPLARRVLAGYTIVGTLFIAYIMKTMFVMVFMSVVAGLPAFIDRTWRELDAGLTGANVLHALMESGWRILVVTGACFTFLNIGKAVMRMAGNLRRATRAQGGG